MTCGIYRIKNFFTHQFYIGSSKDIERRIRQHFSALRHNRHENLPLQDSFYNSKEFAFSWDILEYCEESILKEREQIWILRYYYKYGRKALFNDDIEVDGYFRKSSRIRLEQALINQEIYYQKLKDKHQKELNKESRNATS
jgi:group I intron endonuclease